MAKIIENQTTRTNYPAAPFGHHAGTREFVMTYGGPTVNTDDIPPVRGCSFDDPLSADDKDLLCRLALARVDNGGRFEVDYEALRAHLRAVCGVRDMDLHGLTWGAVMEMLTPTDRAQQAGAGNEQQDATSDLLTFDVAQRLFEVSRPTLQRAVRSGELRSYRKADKGKHRVRVADLERLFGRRKGSQL